MSLRCIFSISLCRNNRPSHQEKLHVLTWTVVHFTSDESSSHLNVTNNLKHCRRAPAVPDAGDEEITAGAVVTRRELRKKNTHCLFWMMPSLIVCDGSQQGRQSGARNHNTFAVTSSFVFFFYTREERRIRGIHTQVEQLSGRSCFQIFWGEVHVITSERFPSTAQLITLFFNAEAWNWNTEALLYYYCIFCWSISKTRPKASCLRVSGLTSACTSSPYVHAPANTHTGTLELRKTLDRLQTNSSSFSIHCNM